MEVTKFGLLMHSGSSLLVAVKVDGRIFVNQLNATNLKSSKTQIQLVFKILLNLGLYVLIKKMCNLFPLQAQSIKVIT